MFKNLNLTKYLFSLLFIGSFLVLNTALAASLQEGFGATGNLRNFATQAKYSTPQTPEYYIGLALTGLFSLLGIIVMAMIFYSGFVWMTARGNDTKVTKAKDNLIDALLGLLFVVGGYALTSFVLKIFT